MSMAELTTIQIIELFVVYGLVVIALPAIAFGPRLQKFSFPLRMMAYYTVGNFVAINVVLYLQLLHISCRFTLVLATLAFYGYFYMKNRDAHPVQMVMGFFELMNRRYRRSMGRRSFWRLIRKQTAGMRHGCWNWILTYVIKRIPEWVAFVGLSALVWHLFGHSFLVNLGYGASDIPVHNMWINELSKNNLFCDGIYPFGMHALVYYFHQVFHMDTYVLLRIWGLMNIYSVTFMLVAFLAWASKSATYLAFLGGFLYLAPAFIQEELWYRFFSALPQEYGMAFILPSMAFLFEGLCLRRKELEAAKDAPLDPEAYAETGRKNNIFPFRLNRRLMQRWKKELSRAPISTRCFFFFSIALSLTIAIHFYPAIITLLLCIGVGIGFTWVICTKCYFGTVLRSGILAFVLATLPFFFAFVGGTPFQGSMNWAISVMSNGGSGEDTEDDTDDISGNPNETSYTYILDENGNVVDVVPGVVSPDTYYETHPSAEGGEANVVTYTFFDKLRDKLVQKTQTLAGVPHEIRYNMDEFLLKEEYRESFYSGIFVVLFALGLWTGVGLLFIRQFYGRALISMTLGYGFLLLICSTNRLNLPVIMDISRGRLFMYYIAPAIAILTLNGAFVVIGKVFKPEWFRWLLSVVCTCGLVYVACANGFVQPAMEVESMEYPGAITCVTNIVENSDPYTYTIVSANDELHMVEERGFHYEILSLLKHLALYEGDNYSQKKRADITEVNKGHLYLPTQDVYVFIEKVPLDYFEAYEGSGQRVSKEGAAKAIPNTKTLWDYKGENRWICMSKTYYWMKAFRELHPDAVSVYYEDVDFVCYRIQQNTYSLYDLCIDYGFNHCGEKEITVND